MSERLKVLFVEDDPAVRFGGTQALSLAGLEVEAFDSADAVRTVIHPYFPGVLVADVKMRGMDGLALLDHVRRIDPELPVILITGHGDISMAVQAMRAGAYDFMEKPFSSDHLIGVVERALEKRRLTFEVRALRQRLEDRAGIERILIGQSGRIEELRRTILSLADASPDVLILGETGTGKELVAQCLHQSSPQRGGRFVALNCGAMPEAMFESEVFGHEAGAFTSAQKRRIGKMEYAAGGTLFLDEIESMPLSLQVKLLRALQERRIERLGSNEPITVDTRIVAATKSDLEALGREQKFRTDLYYRLSVVTLEIPPLRERREDIPLLFEHFVLLAASRYRRRAPMLSGGLMRELMAHPWPGNVRELRNVADRFVLGVLGGSFAAGSEPGADGKTLAQQVEDFERSLIVEQLRTRRGSVAAASEALGTPKKTLYDKIRKYGLVTESYR
jgi:two-component system C4-dicarboxylate transport response regulator DctD